MPSITARSAISVANSLLQARKDDCDGDSSKCEKPVSPATTWIVTGCFAGAVIFAIAGVVFYLHKRRQRLDKRDDANDRFKMSDYGIDEGNHQGSRGDRYDSPPRQHGTKGENPFASTADDGASTR